MIEYRVEEGNILWWKEEPPVCVCVQCPELLYIPGLLGLHMTMGGLGIYSCTASIVVSSGGRLLERRGAWFREGVQVMDQTT